MNQRIMQFRVGVLALVTIVLIVSLVLLFGELPTLAKKSYTVYIQLPYARGVTEGTPVRKNGILIGRVTDVSFTEDDEVLITAEIDGDVRISKRDVAQLRTTFLGDAELEFIPARSRKGEKIADSPERSRAAPPPRGPVSGDI